MPRKNSKQKASSGARAGVPARPKGNASKPKAGMSRALVPYAASSGMRTKFEVTSSRKGSSSILRVHIVDQLAELDSRKFNVDDSGIPQSDAIPFSLTKGNPALSSLGMILPKLQGFVKISSRYQVRRARVYYQSVAAASAEGVCAYAIVPGLVGPVSSIAELASYDNSAVGPVWQSTSTPQWMNAEQRFYHTQADYGSELPPFTILRIFDQPVTPYASGVAGLFWLDLEVDFIDLQPMPQANASFVTSAARTVTGGSGFAQNALRWLANTAMEGLWAWGRNRVATFLPPVGSPLLLEGGSSVDSDGGNRIEWFGDVKVEAVSLERVGPSYTRTWPIPEDEEKEYHLPPQPKRAFPLPWKEQPRIRTLCAFRNLTEAVAAQKAGFDPLQLWRESSNAAGDFIVYLTFQPQLPGVPVVNIASFGISGGTGAVEVKLQTSFDQQDAAGSYVVSLTPTGTENRTIAADTSMDFTVVSQLTSSYP